MSNYAITVLMVFAIAAVLHSKGARPFWLFGLAGLAFLATGVFLELVPTLLSNSQERIQIDTRTDNGTLHDTYYVVSHLSFARPVGVLILAITGFLALQQILGAMYLPRLTRWLFWPLAGGMALAPIVQTLTLAQIPRRYVDDPLAFSWAYTLEVTLAVITYTAAALLAGLFLGSLLWRFKTALQRPK